MSSSWSGRLGAIAGVAFAVFIMLSVMAVDPLREATDSEVLDWWTKDSNVSSLYVSMYFRLLAVPFLLAFLVPLRARLRAAEGSEGWSDLVSSLGILAAAGLAISAIGRGMLAQSIDFNDEPVPGVDMLRFVIEDSVGVYSLVAMPALAILVSVVSVISLRTRAFATWFAWLGVAVAVLSLAMVALLVGAFASPLLAIWSLAASFCLFRGAEPQEEGITVIEARGATS